MKLIIGLGNPGRLYAGNRHNVGFRCINYFAKLYNIPLNKGRWQSRFGLGKVADKEIVLAKPQTFVNLSGQAVKKLREKFMVPLTDLVVIHDDLDLLLGKIRLRQGGSSGGHKGVESIAACLGGQDFIRIKVGIGRPSSPEGKPLTDEEIIASYVLSDFTPEEEAIIKVAISRVAEALYCLLTQGMEIAMNRFN